MISTIDALGTRILHAGAATSEFTQLVASTFLGLIRDATRWRETLKQIDFVANQSLGIVVFCVSFAAVVTIMESAFHMKLVVQNDALVPGFAALLILRELGAVVSALLLTSKIGAGYAAEVGTMKITEQIEAIKMLGLDPIGLLVVPRFLACLTAGLVISLIANIVCLFAAMVVSTIELGHTSGSFLAAMRTFVDFKDLVFAGIKGMCFGAVIPLFSCFFGFRCRPGAEGVGLATTNSVVATSIAIIILDFLLSFLFSFFY